MHSLRLVLRLNAASCLLFGALFVVAPTATAAFLGAPFADIIRAAGLVLALNGLHLAWASRRNRIAPLEVVYFSAGDIIWMNLTFALIALGELITTPAGIAASLIVALGVAAFGIAQISAVTRPDAPVSRPINDPFVADDHLPPHLSTARSIAVSWLAMKTWVKIWLFGVNAALLASIAFWPDPIAKLTLAAYLASGPWLLAIMLAQRGLTRLLGLAHLIPWTPLLVCLLARLYSDLFGQMRHTEPGPLFLYMLVLTFVVDVCLAFDAFDVWRWSRGERFRLGSASAARVGASALATQGGVDTPRTITRAAEPRVR